MRVNGPSFWELISRPLVGFQEGSDCLHQRTIMHHLHPNVILFLLLEPILVCVKMVMVPFGFPNKVDTPIQGDPIW